MKIALTIFLLLLGFSNAGYADQTELRFFSSLPDVPLMEGLNELSEDTVSFDKPEGRIVESYAAIDSTTPERILDYYRSILPQFGWTRLNAHYFVREGEALSLNFETIDGQSYMHVLVSPQ